MLNDLSQIGGVYQRFQPGAIEYDRSARWRSPGVVADDQAYRSSPGVDALDEFHSRAWKKANLESIRRKYTKNSLLDRIMHQSISFGTERDRMAHFFAKFISRIINHFYKYHATTSERGG